METLSRGHPLGSPWERSPSDRPWEAALQNREALGPKSKSLECKAQLGHCRHVTRTSATFQSPEVLLIKHPWLHDDKAMLVTWQQGVGLNEIR